MKKVWHHTKEAREKISEAQKGEKNFMYGKHLMGENSPHWKGGKIKFLCIICNKERYVNSSVIKKGGGKFCSRNCYYIWMSQNSKGENNLYYGKYGENHPKWKGGEVKIICEICGKEKDVQPYQIKMGNGRFCSSRCFGIWNNKHMKKKDTSIEIAVEKELIKRHISYLKQVPIKGIALVDFLLSNKIVIQADGDYWHSLKGRKSKDIAQDVVLGFKGYKIYRFSETEIKKSAKGCINKIFINEARICQ